MRRFGTMLRVRREMAGLTQQDLAARLGVSRATISRWELGTDLPASANVDDIARFVRIPMRDLTWLIEGRKTDRGEALIESRIASLEERMAEVVTILNDLFDHVSCDTQRIAIAVGSRSVSIDGATGTITIQDPNGNEIRLDSSGIHLNAPATLDLAASIIDATASMIDTQAAMAKLHGIVKCDTLMATSVIANAYTSGAGNIW